MWWNILESCGFRANDIIWAVEVDPICIRVSMIVFNCKHMDRDHLRLMALGSDAEKGHRVAVASHIDVRGKLV